MIRGISIFIFPIIVFQLFAFPVFACTCISETTCELSKSAEVVFTGTATEVRQMENGILSTRFGVEETFKGLIEKNEIEIQSHPGVSCGISFEIGEKWIIFAGRFEGAFVTSLCSGNKQVGDNRSKTILERLRIQKMKGIGFLAGKVHEYPSRLKEPLDKKLINVRAISSTSNTYLGEIDGFGEFQIAVPPGKYELRLTIPLTFDYEVFIGKISRIKEGRCSKVDIGLGFNNSIAGRVIDVNGNPLGNLEVELFREDKVIADFETDFTDPDTGEFSFRLVPPGDYMLGINSANGGICRRTYPTVFFPGVNGKSETRVVSVTRGDNLTDLVLVAEQVEPRLKMTGILKDIDGNPIRGASVYISGGAPCEIKFGTTLVTDNSGLFTMYVQKEFPYRIRIVHPKLDNPTTKTFTPDSDASELKIVLPIKQK